MHAPSTDARAEGLLGIEGFTRFLFGPECDFVNPEHVAHVYQDMTRPLSHYFIAASHNTYLTDDQLRGPSSPDAYVHALLLGCRCVVGAAAWRCLADAGRRSWTAGTATMAIRSSTTDTR